MDSFFSRPLQDDVPFIHFPYNKIRIECIRIQVELNCFVIKPFADGHIFDIHVTV